MTRPADGRRVRRRLRAIAGPGSAGVVTPGPGRPGDRSRSRSGRSSATRVASDRRTLGSSSSRATPSGLSRAASAGRADRPFFSSSRLTHRPLSLSSNRDPDRRRTRPGGPRCAAGTRSPSATRSRTASITARTSAAEPPSAAWMKLACFSETHAVPIRNPRSPRRVDQPAGGDLARHRVDEHRSAVLPTRLVLAAPAHDLGDLALGRLTVAATRGRAGRSTTTRSSGEVRATEPQPERRRARCADHAPPQSPPRSNTSTSSEARRHVGAVATGVHPHRAADRARARRPPTRTR